MKKLLIITCVALFSTLLSAQTTKSSEPKKEITGAEIQFEKATFDFGEIKIGDVKIVTLTFTNIGKKPLFLDDVISSCDCTKVEWTKEPVMPGQKGTLKATYTAETEGPISKRITIYSNAETDKVVLQTKGNVKK